MNEDLIDLAKQTTSMDLKQLTSVLVKFAERIVELERELRNLRNANK